MKEKKTCRTCRFLRVPQPDSDGKVRYRTNRAHLCLYRVPWPLLPTSIHMRPNTLPAPSWVELTDGENCPVWEGKSSVLPGLNEENKS